MTRKGPPPEQIQTTSNPFSSRSRQTRDTLWTLIAAPTIWALHFLLAYVGAAVACAPNVAIFQAIPTVRVFIAALTVAALLGIGLVFLRALREWRGHPGELPHSGDSDLDRERFLEFSTLLLAGLSFIAVLFVALPALVMADCR